MYAFSHNDKNILSTITQHYQLPNHIHGYIKVVGICELLSSKVGGLSKKAVLTFDLIFLHFFYFVNVI